MNLPLDNMYICMEFGKDVVLTQWDILPPPPPKKKNKKNKRNCITGYPSELFG